jgi:hypothetical protein
LTIDLNVVRDYDDARRTGHADALALFELARDGKVEIARAPQGYRLDVTEGSFRHDLEAILAAEKVEESPQLAYATEATFPSETLFPGSYVPGFSDAWNVVRASWRCHDYKPPEVEDHFHVETHVFAQRDFFLTADRGLLVMCRRLRDEHRINIEAMTVSEYLARHAE